MILDFIALFIMAVLLAVGIWIVVLIGNLPGNMARAAGHPQAEAISLLAWVGLITGIGWFLALIWARYKPQVANSDLERRLAELEARVAAAEAA